MVKVSFVVPVYNVEDYLERCVNSILNQTFTNFEVILIDDGAKDNSGTMCDDFSAQDKRIKVIHKKNGGLSSARNAGMRVASGEYVCFVDSDDWIERDLLAHFFEASGKEIDVFVYGHRMLQEVSPRCDSGSDLVEYISGEEALDRFVLNQIKGYAWNKIVRTSLLRENDIWFPEGRNYEDIPTTYKMLQYAKRVAVTSKQYYNYYTNNTSSITNRDSVKNLKDYYLSCNEMYRGVQEHYKVSEKDDSQLECFRINLFIQLYIRISYYQMNHRDQANIELQDIREQVVKVLKEKEVQRTKMKQYVNYNKYILYKMHILDLMIVLKAKKARGYKKGD